MESLVANCYGKLIEVDTGKGQFRVAAGSCDGGTVRRSSSRPASARRLFSESSTEAGGAAGEAQAMQIDIILDVICPWCFIGKRRLERALAQRPDLIVSRSWRAFQLNPEMPSEGFPHELYIAARFGNHGAAERSHAAARAAGRREGIAFAFERIRRTPNTLQAHRLIHLASVEGNADEMVESLFRGYFLEGLDIGDIATLATIAPRAGLDRTMAERYLASQTGIEEVLAEEHRVRRFGIRAVPYFVLQRGYAISGAQEPEMFLPLFDIAAGPGSDTMADKA